MLGLWPLLRDRSGSKRPLIATGVALVLGAAALLALRHVYSPLQDKYDVGQGGRVIDPFSSSLWRDAGGDVVRHDGRAVLVRARRGALAGVVMLARRDRRAALVIAVWLLQPLITLSLLTAGSSDFAPQRHLSFMLPGFAAALAYAIVEAGRRLPHGPIVATAGAVLLLLPGTVAIARDVDGFNPDLRDASISLARQVRPRRRAADVGRAGRADRPRPPLRGVRDARGAGRHRRSRSGRTWATPSAARWSTASTSSGRRRTPPGCSCARPAPDDRWSR